MNTHCAVQLELGPPPLYPQAGAEGVKLAQVRRQPAPARKSDGVILQRGDQGLAHRSAHYPGRTALALSAGGSDGVDPTSSVPSCTASNGGLIGSVLHLLGPALAVPNHTTLCRRAETLEVPRSSAVQGGQSHPPAG